MKKQFAIAISLTIASVGLSFAGANSANAFDIRDHRLCQAFDPNCRDHRGPVVVAPPRPLPPTVVVQNPPTVIVDPVRPQPLEPPHRQPQSGPWGGVWVDVNNDGISCAEGRAIVRQEGYRQVRAVDCSGEIYRYNAYSRSEGRVTVLVNMDGDIIRVNRWASLR